jgi:hypothetical protein
MNVCHGCGGPAVNGLCGACERAEREVVGVEPTFSWLVGACESINQIMLDDSYLRSVGLKPKVRPRVKRETE